MRVRATTHYILAQVVGGLLGLAVGAALLLLLGNALVRATVSR